MSASCTCSEHKPNAKGYFENGEACAVHGMRYPRVFTDSGFVFIDEASRMEDEEGKRYDAELARRDRRG
jgi:hypothetical protein